jgi:hypothetical protein
MPGFFAVFYGDFAHAFTLRGSELIEPDERF